jgi:hypothetical protein
MTLKNFVFPILPDFPMAETLKTETLKTETLENEKTHSSR